jgi:CheY-like chemotaxis protein
LKAASVGGFRSLRESAVDRVRSGETTLQEVERVVGEADDSSVPLASEVTRPSPIVVSNTGPHALVVDDDAVSRTLARTLLLKNGFRVTEASDGAAALELLGKSPAFTLMVLDLEMPVLGGREVLERVRKSVVTAALPIIVLTGAASEELEAQLMEEGADDYIRKPLDPARFVARVKAALRRAVPTESLAA